MKNKYVLITFCLTLCALLFWNCNEKESSQNQIKNNYKQKKNIKKTNSKKGIEQIADYQRQIRKGINEASSTYKKGYLIEAYNKAIKRSSSRKSVSSINAVFTERGPNNVPGRSRGIAIDPTNSDRWFIGTVGGGLWKTGWG